MAYLINTLEIRTETSMNTEHPAVNDRAEREVIKHFAAPAPDIAASVLALAFVVEPVHLRDLP